MGRFALFLGFAAALYPRAPDDQVTLYMNGFIDTFADWTGPGFGQRGRDWPGLCTTGQAQSPIDIADYPTDPATLQIVTSNNSTFRPIVFEMVPSNPIVQWNEYFNMYYMFSGVASHYTSSLLYQTILEVVVFKVPSEHPINGVQYPLSVVLGFRDATSDGAVSLGYQVYINFREGRRNAGIDQYINEDPLDVGTWLPSSGVLDDYYYYTGSFDIPPCFEQIPWFISNYVVEAAPDQIAYFQDLYVNDLSFSGGTGNIRATQPLNGRTVYHFIPSPEDSQYLFYG